MRISFVKILVIIFFAVAVALLFNYLQPDGIPLFNENRNEASRIDEQLDAPPPPAVNKADTNKASLKHDYNKMAVEKNRVAIDEDILPSYKYKNDSDLTGSDDVVMPDAGSNNDGVNLSNLTKDVFNQPRLISLAQAYELYRDKVLFVDGRDSSEFEDGHIAGAVNLPYMHFDQFIYKLSGVDKSDPIVTYCEGADCDISIRLGNELFSNGYRKVFVFFGGWEEWKKADYPVVMSNANLQLN